MNWLSRLSRIDKFLITLGAVGALFICTCDYFLWFNVSASDKINSTILWWTALAVVWYTIETYDLRKSSEKQVDIQETVMMNEFMPILMPDRESVGKALIQHGGLTSMFLRNYGKGVASDIKVTIEDETVWRISVIASNEQEQALIEAVLQPKFEELLQIKQTFQMKLQYKDIYGRDFTTHHIMFKKDDDPVARLLLTKDRWQFQVAERKK